MDAPHPCRNQPLGQILNSMEVVSEGHLQEALQIQRKQGGRIGEVRMSLGHATPDEVELALLSQRGRKFVDVREIESSGSDPEGPPAS